MKIARHVWDSSAEPPNAERKTPQSFLQDETKTALNSFQHPLARKAVRVKRKKSK